MDLASLGQAVGLAVVAGIGGWVAAYYGAFWKKKGEQAATHDDLENVLKEVRAVTKTTEEIKAEISGGVWDRQKRWELKREVLFEATRRVAAQFDALKKVDVVLQTRLANPSGDETQWTLMNNQANEKWFDAKAALDESRLFIGVTCGKDVADIIDKFSHVTTTIAATINKGDGNIFRKSTPELFKLDNAVRDALREELGIDSDMEG
jgi:hypothetical protein